MHALSKIETEARYKDAFDFEVVSMGTPEGEKASKQYDWQGHGHGLVILRKGKLLALIPGHQYGRDKIIEELDKALASR